MDTFQRVLIYIPYWTIHWNIPGPMELMLAISWASDRKNWSFAQHADKSLRNSMDRTHWVIRLAKLKTLLLNSSQYVHK